MKDFLFAGFILPEPYHSEINFIKNAVAEKFRCLHALKTPPHITILPPFHMDQSHLAGFNMELEKMLTVEDSFYIHITGFGFFTTNHVAFLDVELSTQLKEIKFGVMKVLKNYLIVKDQKFHPHITIAHRDVEPAQFRLLKSYLESMPEYVARIPIRDFILFKHYQRSWTPVSQYKLQSLVL
jgi:2'-5' RNA ligase